MGSSTVKKDSTGVIVGRVFMTIFLTVFIGLMSMTIALRVSLFSLSTWREFFTSEKTMDAFMETTDLKEVTEDPLIEGRIDEDFFKDYARFLIDELFDAMETGDTEIDEDVLDDIYDDYLEDLVRNNAPRSERDRFKYDFFDITQETIDETYDEMEDTGFTEYMHKANTSTNVFIIVMAVLSIALIATMVAISKEKFAAMRNTGIALTVCEAFNSLIVFGLGTLIVASLNSADVSDGDEALMDLLTSFFRNITNKALTILIVGLVAGIVFIVVGEILRRNARKVNDVDEEERLYSGAMD